MRDLIDGSQRNGQRIRVINIARSDDRNVSRHPATRFVYRLYGANGDWIVVAEHAIQSESGLQ